MVYYFPRNESAIVIHLARKRRNQAKISGKKRPDPGGGGL